MLLGGGILEGQRLLSPAAVRLMTANMVGPLFSGDGLGYSLAFQTVERTGGGGSPATAGSFGWGGAYQSDYSVDPAEDLVAVVLTQHLPNVRIDLGRRFLSLVYRALVPSDPR